MLKVFFLLLLISCSPNATRRITDSKNLETTTHENVITFSSDSSFIQAGENKVYTLMVTPEFNDYFNIRGTDIHHLLEEEVNSETNTYLRNFCVGFYFGSEILIAAAIPYRIFNPSSNTYENTLSLNLSNTSNQAFCGSVDVINKFAETANAHYDLESLLLAVNILNQRSTTVNILTTSGEDLPVNLTAIGLYLTEQGTSGPASNFTCTQNSDCTSRGLDCCSNSMCVNDGELKRIFQEGDELYPRFLEAIERSKTMRNIFLEYPDVYHSCVNAAINSPTIIIPNPLSLAQKIFETKADLYNCTTPLEGEMSICTIVYSNTKPDANTTYQTKEDDRSFETIYTGSVTKQFDAIAEVYYGKQLLYNNNDSSFEHINIGGRNDNLTTASSIVIGQLPTRYDNQDLIIRYKIDGSCEQINDVAATCTKYYVHGQNLGRIDDHYPVEDRAFKLPYYANLLNPIEVLVDGISMRENTHWFITGSSIVLRERLKNTQKVEIKYYVDLTTHNVMLSKKVAQDEINRLCGTAAASFKLTPVYKDVNGEKVISDYICESTHKREITTPLDISFDLSSKAVPHLYFDEEGLFHETAAFAGKQEGNSFSYNKNDLMNPINLNQYVGFNEIYGSFTGSENSAVPATMVRVEYGKTYDIEVSDAFFTPCYGCGSDYYSLNQLFPGNSYADQAAAGVMPDPTVTSRETPSTTNAKGASIKSRIDDFHFNRACFIPATMIPWTHIAETTVEEQRRSRLAAQHFLFANGYQRDWYGFNYGSVIGSFDGVSWFAVGTGRKVLAKGNRLFLAINAYYADQTTWHSYKVRVNESFPLPNTGPSSNDDYSNNGASCRRFHECVTDQDCVTKLGWEYSCQSINNITTSWPVFDHNGNEYAGQSVTRRLMSLVDNIGESTRKCVYRGRGAPCTQNPLDSGVNNYAGTDSIGLNSCNTNYYCEGLLGTKNFQNRISRFAKQISSINYTKNSTYPTFGLSTPIIGRNYSYFGNEAVQPDIQFSLMKNLVSAICIPGRNVDGFNFTIDMSNYYPPTNNNSDRLSGIGMTSTNYPVAGFYSFCSVLGENGNYIYNDYSSVYNQINSTVNPLNLPLFAQLGSSQNISTTALNVFAEVLPDAKLLANFDNNEDITEKVIQENVCLRAPGSPCHSDWDCAPNVFITNRLSSIDASDPNMLSLLNYYEIKYWQEELICSQKEKPTSNLYDLTNNKCCRALGKTITLGTQIPDNDPKYHFIPDKVAGNDLSFYDPHRYSRISTVYREMTGDLTMNTGEHPPLRVGDFAPPTILRTTNDYIVGQIIDNSDYSDPQKVPLNNQFNTINTTLTRTCCTNNWIRNFHKKNGGGHTWTNSRTQKIDKSNFNCLNWEACPFSGINGNTCYGSVKYTCDQSASLKDGTCPVRNLDNQQIAGISDFMASLDLIGIPQAVIKSAAFSETLCNVNPTSAALKRGLTDNSVTLNVNGVVVLNPNDPENAAITDPELKLSPIPGTIDITKPVDYLDPETTSYYYAGTNYSAFVSGSVKEIFAEDEFTCCIPTGVILDESYEAKDCCTGMILPITNEEGGTTSSYRCALPDYTDVSLYLNRYVSSEASTLNARYFDELTGFIKGVNPFERVVDIACEKKICASNKLALGVAVSFLKVDGLPETEEFVRNFIANSGPESENNASIAKFYDAGLRWNNHVYCVPDGVESDATNNLHIFECSE